MQNQYKRVHQGAYRAFGLSNADTFQQYLIEAVGISHRENVGDIMRQTLGATAARDRAHIRAQVIRQRVHADSIAQQRSAAHWARWVHRQNGDSLVAHFGTWGILPEPCRGEARYQAAFSRPGG